MISPSIENLIESQTVPPHSKPASGACHGARSAWVANKYPIVPVRRAIVSENSERSNLIRVSVSPHTHRVSHDLIRVRRGRGEGVRVGERGLTVHEFTTAALVSSSDETRDCSCGGEEGFSGDPDVDEGVAVELVEDRGDETEDRFEDVERVEDLGEGGDRRGGGGLDQNEEF